jgi:transcriptional regulator with XRE-family HTH domain
MREFRFANLNNKCFNDRMAEDFQTRLSRAFNGATMAEIARRIEVPHATIRNYFAGRLPAPEVLIKIAKATNISLNWLLIGAGDMYAGTPKQISLDRMLEAKIGEIIDRKFASRATEVQELGSVDEAPGFDVELAIREYDDPQRAMSEWFKHEGREYPADYGVIFFQGWNAYSYDEKIEALRDAKKVLDRTLKNQ